MSTEEEYKELSAKLRYGLELAEQRLIEVNCTARRDTCVMVVPMEK